ncbi:MAG: oligosaccharide repeat unit polymerase [Campylobacterales bacterium]|nr:oligosaccharide repeat unit polymerase [Campylobacterales bacterium]
MGLYLHPIVFFSIGTFIGLTPYIFGSTYFNVYRTFTFSSEILIVYMIGFIFFSIGVLLVSFVYKKKHQVYSVIKKDINLFLIILIFLSILIFLKIISLYGTLPILALLSGNESIAFVNQTQKDVGGGLFGVFFLTVISLIVLFPYSVIYKNKSFLNKSLFWIHLCLLIIYTTYSGKRQMMFIFFTYSFSYLLIYYTKIDNTKVLSNIKKIAVVSFSLLIGIFLTIGLVRTSLTNDDVSLLDPIVHYASLPFINLTSIIINQENNSYAYTFISFFETILSDLPTFAKGMMSMDFHTLQMPLIEPTSPPTIYGEIFWNFGYIGVIVYLFIVGIFSGVLYFKALYSQNFLYITLYSLIVWPLLSIHTYNHFKNFMFLIIPLIMIVFGSYIYKKISKKRKVCDSKNKK